MQINGYPNITSISGNDLLLIQTASDNAYKKIKRSDFISGIGGGSSIPYILLTHTLSSGTNGGSGTFGAWTNRPINTIDYDDTSLVTLASNAFVLPSGTYWIDVESTFYNFADAKLRLRNNTANTTILQGLNGYVNPGGSVALPLILNGKFAVGATQSLSLQYWTKTSGSSSTFNYGGSVSDGTPEKYASIQLWKVG